MKYRDAFQKTDSFRFDRNTSSSSSSSSGYGSGLSLSPTDHSFLSHPKAEIYECVWNLDEQIDRIRSTINQQIHPDCQSIISMSVDEPSSIHDDQELLSAAAWYQEGLPRHICEEYLLDNNQPIGSFIIRHCHTHPEYPFVLSVKIKSSFIEHFLLERTIDHDGYRLQGSSKTFDNISTLVLHHTIIPDILPITLVLTPYRQQSSTIHSVRF